MDKKENIRNVSVIADCDFEKSDLSNSMLLAAGIRRNFLMRADGIGSSELSVYYETTDVALQANKYYINVIDLPPSNVFSSEVTAALRISDGALVVVDCIKGNVSVDTETVIRQALGERIRPVLTVNKIDHCFLKPQVDGEELYATFQKVIENANIILATFEDPLVNDFHVYPEKGTVAFSGGLHGWAFTLTSFAKMYASKFGVDESKMMERLWGENFFDPATRKWTTKNSGSPTCKRGFVLFCYEPIKQIIDVCMNDQKDKLWPMLTKLGVQLNSEEKDLVGASLMKCVMQTWLPAGSALIEMMIHHLPSPATAQKYRVEKLYKGPIDDHFATAIRNCDPDGPLMLYVSKLITTRDGHWFARCRVFSGKLSSRMDVKIMGPQYVAGGMEDLSFKKIRRMTVLEGKQQVTVTDVSCGNTPFLLGLDRTWKKYATLTNRNEVDAHPIRAMRGRFCCWFCGETSNNQNLILQHASVLHSYMKYKYCKDENCSVPFTVEGHWHYHRFASDHDEFDDNLEVEAG